MANIVKVDLNGPGARYVNSRLEAGGIISTSLLQTTGPVGSAYSPLPDGVSSRELLQFEHGGITTQRETLRWLATDVATKFPVQSEFCFLVEDSWAKPTDPSIYTKNDSVLLSGTSVIYAIPGEKFDEIGLKQLLRSVESFAYTGFVASCRLPDVLPTPFWLSDDIIIDFVKHIKLVVVSAFDREGLAISEVGPRHVI